VDVMVFIEAALVGPGVGRVGEARKRADLDALGDRVGRGINDLHRVDVRGVDFGCRDGVDAVGTTPSTALRRTGAIARGAGSVSTAGEGVGAGALDLRDQRVGGGVDDIDGGIVAIG